MVYTLIADLKYEVRFLHNLLLVSALMFIFLGISPYPGAKPPPGGPKEGTDALWDRISEALKKNKKKYYTAHWSVLGLRRDISLTVRHVTFNHQYISSNLVYPIKKRGGFGEEVFT